MEQLNDKIFCLEYEMQALAGQVNYSKLERWVPGFTDPFTDFDHTQRYQWVCSYVNNKDVLDMACGTGKGSYMMATSSNARHVLGCDLDKDAIRYAGIKYKAPNLAFEIQDASSFKKGLAFDVIVSFETVEHIKEVGAYLTSMDKALKQNGLFIVSTPISKYKEDTTPFNPFHIKEWGFSTFRKLISTKFKIEKTYIQMHEKRPYTFMEKLMNRFSRKEVNYLNTTLEEYTSQVSPNKFGKQYVGFQILVCGKKQ